MTTLDQPFTTTEAYILSRLPEIRARIAELRRTRCHVTAGIMRDETLSQIEQWLDPDGMGKDDDVTFIFTPKGAS